MFPGSASSPASKFTIRVTLHTPSNPEAERFSVPQDEINKALIKKNKPFSFLTLNPYQTNPQSVQPIRGIYPFVATKNAKVVIFHGRRIAANDL